MPKLVLPSALLQVTYSMWGRKEGEKPFKAQHKGGIERFTTLDEARRFAAFNGYSGIKVKEE